MSNLGNKVLVVGDIMLDRYIIGSVERISPEAPVPVVLVNSEKVTLGGAANVANNLANLGMSVTLFGGIGKDTNGEAIEQLMRESNIEGILLTEGFSCTIAKTRIVVQNQQLVRVDREQPITDL